MVLKTMARAATKAAVKAASNPLKAARKADNVISKAAKTGIALNVWAKKIADKKYYTQLNKAEKAISKSKAAKWPVEKAVTKKIANREANKMNKTVAADKKFTRTYHKVNDTLSKYVK